MIPINKVNVENNYLRIDWSVPRVTTVASVACRDMSLDRASDVLLWMEKEERENNFQFYYKHFKRALSMLYTNK